ncbi:MAG TPA: DoxX family protein [Tepidisphaeraceae bacterium]|nr:DoxX family protein [Tepidisphaeraceae bacterium]
MTQVIEPAVRDSGPTTSTSTPDRPSRAAWWAGWIISAIPILWMGVLGTVFALTNRAMVEQSMANYGYAVSTVIPIQIIAVACVILYAIPRTALLGAILLTGYLGGATATHVRAGEAWFFPVVFGVLVWLGLVLREPRLREMVLLRKG